MKVIGIAGDKGAGKNTFAKFCIEYLEENYPELNGREEGWSHLLKESAAASLGYKFETKEELLDWADEFKTNGVIQIGSIDKAGFYCTKEITGREYFQLYGTEAHREVFGQDFWVDAFWSANEFQDNDIVFICDTRFENEAQSIKERGGIILNIANERVNNGDNHASEAGLPREYIDIVVSNHGTIDGLEASAETFVNSIKELNNG